MLKTVQKRRSPSVVTARRLLERLAVQGQDKSLFRSAEMPWTLYPGNKRWNLFESQGIWEFKKTRRMISWHVSDQENPARDLSQSSGSRQDVSINGPIKD
ncbi:hypothetical protein NQ315_009004 [Exocentrus adspersus]|uniref:Uncharacterized protein n=1 Tax=Exocentrus adspersus TaxID=1586481 RepID=A0AAV8VGH0_9CUCU|nr:hypothetical protein NQ315_009004 [Exocentrus adspersus]